MKLLEEKNVIITGASRGIGRGIAKLFSENGANVAFTYLSSVEQAKLFEKELSVNGCKLKGYKSDASDFRAAEKLSKDVIKDFGGMCTCQTVKSYHCHQRPEPSIQIC